MHKIGWILLAGGFFNGGHALAEPSAVSGLSAKVDAFVRAEMQREKVPGVAIGVVRGGQVIVASGYGFANVEQRSPVTAGTLFQSGSIGKQFTAAAVMLQVEDGNLGLDDPITKYFADAPENWRRITIRRLLTHTSGIPDYVEAAEAQPLSLARPKTIDYRRDYTEEELRKIALAMPLSFDPGARWQYSNTAYALLGILIHQVSGRFYGDELRDRIFVPLGMSTARIISEADIIPDRASGYRLLNGELKNQEWVSPSLNTTADGSLYLSVLDLIAWDGGLRARALLKPQSWTDIYTPVALNSGKSYPYGFGWFINESGGKPWYFHSGSWQGFETFISRYLAEDLTIIVLTNLAQASPQRFVDGIAMIMNPGLAKLAPSAPIADAEPDIASRVRALLGRMSSGRLSAQELPFIGTGFPEQARHLQATLRPLGTLRRIELVARRDLGDDRSSTFLAVYDQATLRVEIDLAPDKRISGFDLSPE